MGNRSVWWLHPLHFVDIDGGFFDGLFGLLALQTIQKLFVFVKSGIRGLGFNHLLQCPNHQQTLFRVEEQGCPLLGGRVFF
jgi:hypothetical protein